MKIFQTEAAFLASYLTPNIQAGVPVEVLGKTAPNDGSGTKWSTTGAVDLTKAGTIVSGMAYDQRGNQLERFVGDSVDIIARSLNVLDSQVIYSTDTVTVLDNVLYIYDAGAQVTWGVPTLDSTGKTIVSVVGSALTTTSGTGSNTYTILPVELTPEMQGAKDDIADDDTYTALQYLADTYNKITLTPHKIYNLNGNTLSLGSGCVFESTMASIIKNGSIECNGASYEGNIFGDLNLIDCDTRIGGAVGEANFATGFKIGNVKSNEIFRLQYMSDYDIGLIRVNIPVEKDSATQRAMGWTCLYSGIIAGIHLSGYYAMGFETAGNGSTPDVFASKDAVVGFIISDRNSTATTSSGLHGIYLHGNVNLQVGVVTSTGYDILDQGVSNDFKFRDNWDSNIDKLTCLTAQMSSDANSTTLNSCERNTLSNVSLAPDALNPTTTGKMTITTSGTGFFSKNTINNFRGELGTSGTLVTDGNEAVKMTGNIDYIKDGNLQLSNIVYDSAVVRWDGAETNYYTRPVLAHSTHFVDRVRIQSDLRTYGCRLEGGLRLETLGSTRELVHANTTIDTDWDTVLSTGTVNADISNTNINVDRPGATLRPNGVIRYRFLSFNDVYHIADNDGSNFIIFP